MKYVLLTLLAAAVLGSGLVVADGQGVLLPELALVGVSGALCGAYLYSKADAHRLEWALFGVLANTDALLAFSVMRAGVALWTKRHGWLGTALEGFRTGFRTRTEPIPGAADLLLLEPRLPAVHKRCG